LTQATLGVLDGRGIDMRLGAGLGIGLGTGIRTRLDGWGRRSQDRAVANARAAATVLSRARVEREEIDLYLRGRAERPAVTHAVRPA
jgi:hypothetical protein